MALYDLLPGCAHLKNDPELEFTDLSSVRSRSTLAKLCLAGKITMAQYERAEFRLSRESMGPVDHSAESIKVHYPSPPDPSSDPPISPITVLDKLDTPPPLPDDITASARIEVIDGRFLVKYGGVDPAEAWTMLFVREHTSIPVPQIHLVFSVGLATYIVMEYIAGGDLLHRWPRLCESERQSAVLQVKQYLDELRCIAPACDTPGPLGGGVCRGRWFSDYGAGPFSTHGDLVNWWNSWSSPGGNRDDLQVTEGLRADKPLVFSHCDIAPRNLVLREGVVYVVDWEQAGWYPEYLEYCYLASETGSPDYPTPDDWTEAIMAVVPAYPNEYKFLNSIYPRLYIGFPIAGTCTDRSRTADDRSGTGD